MAQDDSKTIEENEKETASPTTPNGLNFDDNDEKYINETRQIFYNQCPSLQNNENQANLLQLLSYERRNNDYPLAIYLINSFLKDRLLHYISQNKILSLDQWSKGKLLTNLLKDNKNAQSIHDNIIGGIRIYFSRYTQPMSLPSQYLINDRIERFVQCLQEVNGLIKAILKDAVPPFQVTQTTIYLSNYFFFSFSLTKNT